MRECGMRGSGSRDKKSKSKRRANVVKEKLFVESDSLDHKLDKLLSHYSTLARGCTSRTVSASGAHSAKKKDQETLNCLRVEGW